MDKTEVLRLALAAVTLGVVVGIALGILQAKWIPVGLVSAVALLIVVLAS